MKLLLHNASLTKDEREVFELWLLSNTTSVFIEKLKLSKNIYCSVILAIKNSFLATKQIESSKRTSINSSRLPRGITEVLRCEVENKVIFDYGCGCFQNSRDAIVEHGGIYIGFDPYNRTELDNIVAFFVLICTDVVNFIVCSNVLNVIGADLVLDSTISDISRFSPVNGKSIINVYEGNKSGIGKIVRADQYQRNERLAIYQSKFTKLSERDLTTILLKNGFIYLSK
ncbi:hypothetical protein [Photobacterium kishitanii]|uniref:Uncharacterized protein n=1 Tax=Photobacterium kishitanii TaxID=318456 RepID=A0A2T3KMK3_9GAMM|nr:hypothetical protein [Photobacterium kishitanii]PSV01014.1 hypothetical protein C9J27_03020 [Photobacterium kishitanii]